MGNHVIGNWKMNGTRADWLALAKDVAQGAAAVPGVRFGICPPPAGLYPVGEMLKENSPLILGGQDVHPEPSGAHTGDTAAAVLKDAGATHCIIGHSERRADHGETNALVAAKARRCLAEGLTPILCVGEMASERDEGCTLDVLTTQLTGSLEGVVPESGAGLIIAYEPVWAIGRTDGRGPSREELREVYDCLRRLLVDNYGQMGYSIALLYGGSVKADNAASYMEEPEVNGFLVGGASLKAESFLAIGKAIKA